MRTGAEEEGTMGGIEGMPLQLMIVILVATMCTAILVGWMGSISAPLTIGSLEYEDFYKADGDSLGDIEITVRDGSGNLLEGAVVVLSGLSVTSAGGDAIAVTDGNGVASFGDVRISPGTGKTGEISVSVSKTGYSCYGNYALMVVF